MVHKKGCTEKKILLLRHIIITILFLFFTITSNLIINTALSDDPVYFLHKWTANFDYDSLSCPVAEDINGDGIYEIFIGGRHISGNYCGVICINGANGNIIWEKTFKSLIGFYVPLAIGDLNNDGTYEIVAAAGTRTIAMNCEDGSDFWNVSQDSGWGVPAIADLDGNGYPYVFVASNTGFEGSPKVRKLYGSNGSLAASENINYCCYGGISIADIDRDGDYEIVVSDSPGGGGSNVMDENLNTLWQTGSYTQESHCAVLTDVTGDSNLEVIKLHQASSGVENGGIHVYYADGAEVPGKSDNDLDLTCHCQPSVYDIDKDGNLELITAFDHVNDIWDLGSWSLDTSIERGAEPADMADVMGDSDLEIVSPFAFVDDNTDIYDSTYSNVEELEHGSYGLSTIVQDIDNDGLNELIISGTRYLKAYDTLAVTPTPRQRTDTSFYSERRTNAGIYIPKIGAKCNLFNENPSNDDSDVPISCSSLSVNINEPDGDPIYWTIETSPDIGNSSGNAESDGNKFCSISGLSYSTTYNWWVNVSDGTNWKIQSYTFETEDETYSADSFYVNGKSGLDTNDGSFSSPWKTIQKAVNTLTAGQTVYIMAGLYNEYITPWSGMSSGSPGNLITYTNYQNDKVIIDGTSVTDDWTALIRMDNQKYIRFTNLIFRNSSSHAILCHDGGGSAHNITIDNCTFYNCSEAAIDIKGNYGLYDVLIENNIIYDTQNGWNDDIPSDESITLSNVSRFIVRDNIMYENGKISIDAKSGSHNGVIYNNRINTTAPWSCQFAPQGIYVDAYDKNCNNISIYNNVIWGNGTGYELGTEHGGTLYDITFYNNIYNGTGNAFQINDQTSYPGSHLKTNCKFINNIVGLNTAICFQITDKNSSFKNLTIRNCILNGNIGFNLAGGLMLKYHNVDHILFNILGYSDYYGSYSINGSPCFVDPDNGNFNLLSNSPAIDNGSSVDAPSVDFEGISRPQGAGFDIGAFEFISSYDLTLPQISGISIVTSSPLDTNENYGWEYISCYVIDNIEVDNVYITIILPNNNEINIEMTKLANSDCYYYNSSWSNYGNYSYYIRAIDTSGNTKYSDSYSFSLAPNWDINSDGSCNIFDLISVSNHYNEIGANGWIREDVDNNGVINIFDMTLISNYYNENWYT